MATTLLLEGDDLEALLERARAEGGPSARIVRAEKIRHGGVLGFFAKERFEVALEVPDPAEVPPAAARTGVPAVRPALAQEAPMSQPAPAPAEGALDRFTRRLAAAADDPQVAAREGLLGLADRADAAERATAGAPFLPPSPAPVPDALDEALRKLLDAAPAPVAASPVQPSTSRPEFTALLDQLLAPARPPAVAAVPAPRSPEPVLSAAAAGPAGAAASASGPSQVPPAYREASLPPVPRRAPAPAPAPAQGAVERHTLGRTTRPGEGVQNRDRREDPQLTADRRALRGLGVPAAWTRQLRPGDRFTAVLRMLERMPEVDIDPATRVVAVVGPAASVLLEAHRTALDLPVQTGTGTAPRPVVRVPAAAGAERAAALTEARLVGEVVVAVEAEPDAAGAARAVEALQTIGAGAVIALVDAEQGLEQAQAFVDALGQVDALAVEGTAPGSGPAAVLQLGLPVARLDGIPVDRYTWTAVLLAHLGPVQGS